MPTNLTPTERAARVDAAMRTLRDQLRRERASNILVRGVPINIRTANTLNSFVLNEEISTKARLFDLLTECENQAEALKTLQG